MRTLGIVAAACVLMLASTGNAAAWSLGDEITLIDPSLSMQVVWENSDVGDYCNTPPNDLDRIACSMRFPNFFFGLDAAGDSYAVMLRSDAGTTYFDVLRQAAGTHNTEHLVRITEREELIPSEVIKLEISGQWQVDVVNGEILFNLKGTCATATCIGQGDTKEHMALIRVTGLPPLLDVVLSYDSSSAMSFRVPAKPEGLPSGDFFDVFAGDVATLPSLASASPVDCDVAAGTSPGDVVTVTDPLPDPSAGQSRYYVVAVTSGVERRAGRMRTGGVLSGRDANVLPACP